MKVRLLNSLLLALCIGLGPALAIAQTESKIVSNYTAGVEAYKAGDFRKAFDAWSLGAYEGVSEAQYNLGVLYLEGRGVEPNVDQARAWFLKAAEQGHVEAQYNLGHMALSGMGMEKNVPQTLKWWKLAAEGGYAHAQFNYGRALYLGVEGRKDTPTGLRFIQLAAAQNDQRAVKFLEQNPQAQAVALKEQPEPSMQADGQQLVSNQEQPVSPGVVQSSEPKNSSMQDKSAVDVPAGPEATATPDQPETLVSTPAPARLSIIRDQRTVSSEYLMRTGSETSQVFAGPEAIKMQAQLEPGSLVKVIGIQGDKLEIISPDARSSSGWIMAKSLAYSGESAQQLRNAWQTASKPASGSKQAVTGQASKKRTGASKKRPRPSSDTTQLAAKQVRPAGNGQSRSSMGMDDNTWLFTQDRDAHVIHLFTLLDHDKAVNIAGQPAFRSNSRVYSTRAREENWVFVLLGPYASEADAIVARKQLPSEYIGGARVRLVSRIAENRCAKRHQLEPAQARGLDAYCLE